MSHWWWFDYDAYCVSCSSNWNYQFIVVRTIMAHTLSWFSIYFWVSDHHTQTLRIKHKRNTPNERKKIKSKVTFNVKIIVMLSEICDLMLNIFPSSFRLIAYRLNTNLSVEYLKWSHSQFWVFQFLMGTYETFRLSFAWKISINFNRFQWFCLMIFGQRDWTMNFNGTCTYTVFLSGYEYIHAHFFFFLNLWLARIWFTVPNL